MINEDKIKSALAHKVEADEAWKVHFEAFREMNRIKASMNAEEHLYYTRLISVLHLVAGCAEMVCRSGGAG